MDSVSEYITVRWWSIGLRDHILHGWTAYHVGNRQWNIGLSLHRLHCPVKPHTVTTTVTPPRYLVVNCLRLGVRAAPGIIVHISSLELLFIFAALSFIPRTAPGHSLIKMTSLDFVRHCAARHIIIIIFKLIALPLCYISHIIRGRAWYTYVRIFYIIICTIFYIIKRCIYVETLF